MIVCPVIYFDSSEAKNNAVYAISSSNSGFSNWYIPYNIFFYVFEAYHLVIWVSIQPGAMQLTVIPLEATSLATD